MSTRKPKERPTLNALGKPLSPSYDPNWKRQQPLTSIARLRAPQPWLKEHAVRDEAQR